MRRYRCRTKRWLRISFRPWGGILSGVILLGLIGVENDVAASEFRWEFNSAEQATLFEDGQSVFRYQIKPLSQDGGPPRSNYLHPVYDVSGRVVTEDFPTDHYHHRGIFWAWHQLLWKGKSLADPWIAENIQWVPSRGRDYGVTFAQSESGAELTISHDWVVPNPNDAGAEWRVLRETMRVVARARQEDRRMLEFELSLQALVDGLTIGGSDDDKGYGGFSPRIKLPEDVQFIGQQGPVQPQHSAVRGGAWMDVRGSVDGQLSGITMMVHPSHPGFPLKWILRAQRSMQNPQWPGRQPVTLPQGKSVVLRYGLLLHDGTLSSEALEREWTRFAER